MSWTSANHNVLPKDMACQLVFLIYESWLNESN